MATPKRIGVLGGTFDPIHNAHLAMARAALDAAQLDLVLFVVAARPPHKRNDTVASPEARFAMVEAAVADEPRFEADDIELHRDGPSYTGDTLRDLSARDPDAELFLLIGRDSLLDLPSWKDPDAILSRAHLLVAPRPADGRAIPESLEGHYDFLPFQETDVSSTEVRRRAAIGESISDCVPQAVESMIREKGIYASTPNFPSPRAGEFVALLRERLPEKTYHHCISVTRTMLSFVDAAGVTEEQAVTAGLLHDLCKAMKPDELAERATEFGITENLDNPNLLHGPVAAEEAARELGIDDEDVLDAIRFHTTGRAEWSRVGMALFIADFCEPRRTHEGAAEAREMLERKGFEATLRFVVEKKLHHVKKRFTPDPNSQAFEAWVAHEFAR